MPNRAIDDQYAGSIWEKLGYDRELCGKCGNHLHRGICLNGCHLPTGTMERFNKTMAEIAERRRGKVDA